MLDRVRHGIASRVLAAKRRYEPSWWQSVRPIERIASPNGWLAMTSPTTAPAKKRHEYTRWPSLGLAACLVLLLGLVACAVGSSQLNGWTALQPDTDLGVESNAGPNGEDVLSLLYTLYPGKEYAIEHPLPIAGLQGAPNLQLTARATRVLYLVVVLLDNDGQAHECARLLQAGDWCTLGFDAFEPAMDDWSQVTAIRLVDRTAVLVSQGPVSLKLVGLPQ